MNVDKIIAHCEEQGYDDMAQVIRDRHVIVTAYCENKGWDVDDLSFEQILEIRKQQDWIDAGKI